MTEELKKQLRAGYETAYIDGSLATDITYKPGFISNNPREGRKVISTIEDELMKCDSFQISVAFITESGITPLLQTLSELEHRGIPGKILTTDYLCFSEPKALRKLHELKNLTIKMYDTEASMVGFHTKGYIFKKQEVYRIIIGSSNITNSALTSNREWNTKLVSTEQGEVTVEIVILSMNGHLSNDDCAVQVGKLIERGTTHFLLGHLSQDNNRPNIADSTVQRSLDRFARGRDYLLGVAPVETRGGAVIF